MPDAPSNNATSVDVQVQQRTPEDIAKLALKANHRNILKKLAEGKTLTAGERNYLEAQARGQNHEAVSFAKNKAELAKMLGVARKTITRNSKKEGAPTPREDGRLDVHAWRVFLGAGATITDHDAETEQPQITRAQAQAKNILLKNDKLEAEIAILRKNWTPNTQVEEWGGELGAAIRKVVTQLHLLAPNIVGLSVADAENLLKEKEDEILEGLHLIEERISAYRNEPTTQSVQGSRPAA